MALPNYDPFGDATAVGGSLYAVGSKLAGQTNWPGSRWNALGTNATFSGVTPVIASGNLSYPGLPSSTGNSVAIQPSNGGGARLDLNYTGSASGTFYYSFLLKITDLSAVPTYNTNNTIAAFNDDPREQGQQVARLGTRLLTKRSGAGYVLGVGRNNTVSEYVYDTVVRNTSDVVFVVGSYELVGGVTNVNLWVNPDSSTFGAATAPTPTVSATTYSSTAGNINTTGPKALAILCQFLSAPSGVVDELRVGKTWAFITGGPDIALQPTNQTLNAGSTATFVVGALGGPPLSYQWQKDGTDLTDGGKISGATTATLTISNLLQGDAGGYAVVVTNSYGSIISSAATLAVNDPVITTQPVGQTLPPGASAVLQVVAVGTPTLTYQWYTNFVPLSDSGHISGATNATLTINNFSAADAAAYYVTVFNGLGASVTSSNAELHTTDPSIAGQPQSVTNIYGTTATFQVTPSGTAPFSYQWHKAGLGDLSDVGNISGSRTNVLTVSGVAYPDGGTYSVTVTNSLGAVDSAGAVLTVRDPAVVTQPVSVTNNAGTTATFHVAAIGSGTLSYQWQKNGALIFDVGNLSGTGTDTLTVSSVSAADQANYSVVVVGGYGTSETSSDATLTVISPVLITAQPTPRTVPAGTRTAVAVGVTGTAPQYQWQLEGVDLPGATVAAYILTNVQPGVTGNYRVVVSNAVNAQTSSVAAVTIAASMQLYDTNVVAIRMGDGAQALSANGNSMFLDQFSRSGTYVNTVNVPDGGPYGLIGIGPNVVSVGSASSITGNGLTRSADGTHLVIAGYNTNLSYNAALQNSTAVAVPRGVGLIDWSGQYTLAIASTNAFSNIIWRGGLTDGTNNYWGYGRSPGTWYFGFDAPSVLVQGQWSNPRSMGLFNGNLYCVSAVSGNNGVMKLDGMPTTAVTPTVLISSGSTGSSDCEVSTNGNLIYLADDRAAGSGGGVQRWEFDGANWNLSYTLTGGLPNGARYVAADFHGLNPVVYAVTTENDNNQIVAIEDTGSGSTGTSLASAGANQNFRGIRLGPIAATVTTPPLLSFTGDASNLVLNWAGAFFLQSATNVSGPYLDVINGTRPYTNSVQSASQRFFRLRQ